MRVFLYEFITGGGWFGQSDAAPPDSLLREGRAMRDALAADFAAIDGAAVDTLHDMRWSGVEHPGVTDHAIGSASAEQQAIAHLSAEADWTVLIAPEFDGQLLERTRAVERVGGRLLGSPSPLVALTGDKHATAEHLARHGIEAPRGIALAPGTALPDDFPYPAVLKRRDGAGSLGMEWISTPSTGRTIGHVPARLEAFCPGMPASVACLCGPNRTLTLEPSRQHLAGPRDFSYRGGSLPLERSMANRARQLAARAIGSLPGPLGYLGVDLILGDDPDGSADIVIEINPRLTTSYIGLRALSRVNLAAAMIAVACRREIELCWNSEKIEFTSSGIVG